MTEDQNSWDVDLIEDIFSERDANMIFTISFQRMDNDSWFWRKDKLGHYTVKSAYTVLRDGTISNNTSISSGFWNKLWNLNIPLKVKHFMWRAICECLPAKDRLLSRRVVVDNRCPVCNLVEETTFHAIVNCPLANLCWQHLRYMHDVKRSNNRDNSAQQA